MSFYLMHRGWMDDPVFKDEPFTEREAFMWMVENAVWEHEGRKKRLTNSYEMVTLKRGQLCYSLRFLAKKWQWSLGKVQRYTLKLKTDTLIDTAIDTGEIIITICNYDKYQKFSTGRDTAIDTAIDTQTIQQPIQRYKEDKEIKESYAVNARATEKNDFQKIYEAGSAIFPKLATANTSAIHQWINNGCHAELDAIPEIQRKAGKNISSWNFFTDAITNAKTTREAPLPPPEYRATPPPDSLESTIEKVRKKMLGASNL